MKMEHSKNKNIICLRKSSTFGAYLSLDSCSENTVQQYLTIYCIKTEFPIV